MCSCPCGLDPQSHPILIFKTGCPAGSSPAGHEESTSIILTHGGLRPVGAMSAQPRAAWRETKQRPGLSCDELANALQGQKHRKSLSTSLLPLQGVIVKRYKIPKVSLRSALGSTLVALSGRRILWGPSEAALLASTV